eukprot:SAG31_NODE_6105_length_2170_cov_1.536939_3_plen_202_part_01
MRFSEDDVSLESYGPAAAATHSHGWSSEIHAIAHAFTYAPPEQIKGYDGHFNGFYSTYPSGGFIALPVGREWAHSPNMTVDQSTEMYLDLLLENDWIDRHTRALIIDVNIMNADTGMATVARIVVEMSPGKAAAVRRQIQSMILQPLVFDWEDPKSWIELLFVLQVTFYLSAEVLEIMRSICRAGRKYYRHRLSMKDLEKPA